MTDSVQYLSTRIVISELKGRNGHRSMERLCCSSFMMPVSCSAPPLSVFSSSATLARSSFALHISQSTGPPARGGGALPFFIRASSVGRLVAVCRAVVRSVARFLPRSFLLLGPFPPSSFLGPSHLTFVRRCTHRNVHRLRSRGIL